MVTKNGFDGLKDEFAESETSGDLCCGLFSNQPAPFWKKSVSVACGLLGYPSLSIP